MKVKELQSKMMLCLVQVCIFYIHNHRFDDHSISIIDQGHCPSKPVILEKGAWVGACCVILPGVTIIGRNAVVGAGSVVSKNIPAYFVAVGNPARVIKSIK